MPQKVIERARQQQKGGHGTQYGNQSHALQPPDSFQDRKFARRNTHKSHDGRKQTKEVGCGMCRQSPITYDGRKQQAQQHAGQTGPYAPRTHHLHLPEDILRTVLPVQFGNLFDGTERNPQVRRVMQETDDAQVQGRKPHSGRAEQNGRQLVAHHADQYRKHLYASQKARVFYDVVVGRVFLPSVSSKTVKPSFISCVSLIIWETKIRHFHLFSVSLSKNIMKVLLLGEYSNVHWTLAQGFASLGAFRHGSIGRRQLEKLSA